MWLRWRKPGKRVEEVGPRLEQPRFRKKGFPPKRPEKTISCGLKSHPRRDFHRKGLRQQWVVA
jgi:hypothetical protein